MNRTLVILLTGLLVSFSACAKNEETEFSQLNEETLKEEPLSAPLQVNDLKEGMGDAAQVGDTILVHYTGWLYVDGARTTQFDTSRSPDRDRKSTRLNSSHSQISYAVFCLKKKRNSPSRSVEADAEVD